MPDAQSMIERLETAAWNELLRQTNHSLRVDTDDGKVVGTVHMASLIHAILTAMREPTEAMCGDRVTRQHGYAGDIDMVWRGMIDAVLEEGK